VVVEGKSQGEDGACTNAGGGEGGAGSGEDGGRARAVRSAKEGAGEGASGDAISGVVAVAELTEARIKGGVEEANTASGVAGATANHAAFVKEAVGDQFTAELGVRGGRKEATESTGAANGTAEEAPAAVANTSAEGEVLGEGATLGVGVFAEEELRILWQLHTPRCRLRIEGCCQSRVRIVLLLSSRLPASPRSAPASATAHALGCSFQRSQLHCT